MTKPVKISNSLKEILWTEEFIPVPTFDDMWKPTQVFLALRTSCKYFSGKWEEERGQVGEPLLVFCNHPSNSSDVEGNCNEKRCPLLEDWARDQPLFEE